MDGCIWLRLGGCIWLPGWMAGWLAGWVLGGPQAAAGWLAGWLRDLHEEGNVSEWGQPARAMRDRRTAAEKVS